MAEQQKRDMTREEAADYWATHEVTEDNTEESDFKPKVPVSIVLSVRVSKELLKKLSLRADVERIGVTTMARRLIEDGMGEPKEASLAKGYWVTEADQIDTMMNLLHSLNEVASSLRGSGFIVTEEQKRAYEALRRVAAERAPSMAP